MSGEVMWKALAATSGDLVVYLDADLVEYGPHFVPALLGPLLADRDITLVKAFYDRPLLDVSPFGGGRVTLAQPPETEARGREPDMDGQCQEQAAG